MDCEDESDLFDRVLALEEEEYKGGQAEGSRVGQLRHQEQGFVLGWQQACHVLQELGRIEGLLDSVLVNWNTDIDVRLRSQITKLLGTIRGWEGLETAGEEEAERKLTVIHTKTRHILHRLKISSKVIDRSVDGDF